MTRRATPVRVLLVAWGFVAVAYFVAFTSYEYGVSQGATYVMLGFLALFIAGYWVGDVTFDAQAAGRRMNTAARGLPPKTGIELSRFVRVLAVIGLVGALMMTIDYLFLRGIDYSQGVAGARSQLQLAIPQGTSSQPKLFQPGVGSTPWGITSRVLGGFATVAIVLLLLRGERLRDRRTIRLCLASLFAHLFALSLTGGRNSIAIALLVLLGAVLVRRSRGKRVLPPIRAVWLSLAAVVPAAMAYFLYIFQARQEIRGRTQFETLLSLQSSFLLRIKPEAWAIVDGDSLASALMVPLVQLQTYLTHSFQEFSLLLAQRPRPGPFWGLYDLFIPGLLASKFGIISREHMQETIFSSNRTGVYDSLLGSLYRDFGVIGCLIAGFVFGLAAGLVWRRLCRGDGLSWELLGAYIVAALAASPAVSILNTGTGFELLGALLLVAVLSRRVVDPSSVTAPKVGAIGLRA